MVQRALLPKNMEDETAIIKVYPPKSDRLRIERKYHSLIREDLTLNRIVSFVGNKTVPFLRLYRYKEAFAFDFVQKFLKYFSLTNKDYVLDPFVGMGTTCFASMLQNIPSVGIDKLPVAVFVAKTLPLFLKLKRGELISCFEKLKKVVQNTEPAQVALDVSIMKIAFTDENLLALRRWKAAIDTLDQPLRDIFKILFLSILEACSFTSKDGQFLRLKRNKKPLKPEEALQRKVLEAEEDIVRIKYFSDLKKLNENCLPTIHLADSRELSKILFDRPPTAIITSPPYVNRYDYSHTYSLELCFEFVKNFEELKNIRFGLLRSHIESKVDLDEKPPHPSVAEVVEALARKELNNPRIPHMLTAYFIDMKKCIEEWSKILAPNAKVAMVVDNVRFEGELIPADLILSEIAEESGFQVKEIIVSRYKGNSSQQMKKYGRIPVRESVVIWQLKA
jgi:hypothetical protein